MITYAPQISPCKAEVFVNGLPLWLARYPNVEDSGAFGWNDVNDVCNGTMKPGTTCFDSFQWDNLEKVRQHMRIMALSMFPRISP